MELSNRAAAPYAGDLVPNDSRWTTWEAEVGHDVDYERILAPTFWHPQARTLKPRDLIRVERKDSAWSGLIKVMGIDLIGGRVLVVEERPIKIYSPGDLPPGYFLEYAGGDGWRIRQEGRAAPVRSGFATSIDAAEWLRADRAPPPQPMAAPGSDDPGAKAPITHSAGAGAAGYAAGYQGPLQDAPTIAPLTPAKSLDDIEAEARLAAGPGPAKAPAKAKEKTTAE